jgi:hypothetical protein
MFEMKSLACGVSSLDMKDDDASVMNFQDAVMVTHGCRAIQERSGAAPEN